MDVRDTCIRRYYKARTMAVMMRQQR